MMLLWKLAFRNLFVHRLKTVVTGMIIVFGTTLAIVGNSVVDAVSGGMERSLTNSLTGDIQVYSAEAKEKIAVLGSTDGNLPDIGYLPSFKIVREALSEISNVESIVPMGSSLAMFNPGNLLDLKIEELRQAYEKKESADRVEALKEHIRAIVRDIDKNQNEQRENIGGIYGGEKIFKDAPASITEALSPAFWSNFDRKRNESIEFLANKLAPLIFDDNQLYLNYVGTSPELFKKTFPQFEIVKGEAIPEGGRGFLFSDYIYENQVKHRVARRLDQVKKQIEKEKQTIAGNTEIQSKIKANIDQAVEIYNQIDPPATAILIPKLQKLLASQATSLSELSVEFLKMDDSNFAERYKFFYEEIAPHLILYKVKVGDVFALTAFTKSGYSSSVNMKVYGTYRFKSFESSPLAGAMNIVDLVSFRKLFGFMTADRREETKELDDEMGAGDFGRDDIEALFGNPASVKVSEGKSSGSLKEISKNRFGQIDEERRDLETRYSQAEMEDGVFMNAAILLKDPSRLQATMKEIEHVSAQKNLGLQAVDWRDSAGFVGQMTVLVRAVLYLFVLIIFSVAAFIIMNSMLMAALERRREIGTMRAIGAQRSFLLGLFLRETFVLSFIFGLIGTLIGVSIVLFVGSKGIPAMGDVATFFFSGDRLYLSVNPLHIGIVFVCMTLVALISTQYPAWRAMKISPLEAMQSSE